MRPHARQPRQQILILRQLDLELALARAGALGKDVEDQSRAVEHLDAELLAQNAHLRGAQLVVEHREIAVVCLDQLFHFAHLAVADKAAGVGRGALLDQHGGRLAPRRFNESGKLVHRHVGGALARVHAGGREPGQDRAFFFDFGFGYHKTPYRFLIFKSLWMPPTSYVTETSPGVSAATRICSAPRASSRRR